MGRLIDADALKKKWERDHERYFVADHFIFTIEEAPTVDAVPVAHGRWIFGKDDETGERDLYAWTCSECGEKYPWQPNFCPNCGAKMEVGHEQV